MPLYEFVCEGCGERFEALVEIGTDAVDCRVCGEARAHRVLSAQAPPMHLVKPAGERRKQERANERLRKDTKARFKQGLRRARERARQHRPPGGGGS